MLAVTNVALEAWDSIVSRGPNTLHVSYIILRAVSSRVGENQSDFKESDISSPHSQNMQLDLIPSWFKAPPPSVELVGV
jgi:hypothetical protein